MDLTPTETQALLGQTARGFTEREVPPERVRTIVARPDGFDPELWATIAGLGWSGLTISEEFGGGGQGLEELVILVEALGRGPVPSPLIVSATTAALAIASVGTPAQQERWLPSFASGLAVGTLAAFDPDLGVPMAGGATLSGTKVLVPWAATADVVVVTTTTGLHLVEPAGGSVRVTRHDDLGAEPQFAVDLDGAAAEPVGGGGPEEQAAVLRRLRDHLAVAQLAFAVGAGERALDLAIAHARHRQQFGRPIGSFQAVAHRCVDMRTDLDACRYLAYRAAWALDRDDGAAEGRADLAVAAALAYATDAIRAVLAHAHQVLGALGFSTEHDLHLSTRVAKSFELAHGGTAANLERVAAAMGLR